MPHQPFHRRGGGAVARPPTPEPFDRSLGLRLEAALGQFRDPTLSEAQRSAVESVQRGRIARGLRGRAVEEAGASTARRFQGVNRRAALAFLTGQAQNLQVGGNRAFNEQRFQNRAAAFTTLSRGTELGDISDLEEALPVSLIDAIQRARGATALGPGDLDNISSQEDFLGDLRQRVFDLENQTERTFRPRLFGAPEFLGIRRFRAPESQIQAARQRFQQAQQLQREATEFRSSALSPLFF